jgi:hypothetical protein
MQHAMTQAISHQLLTADVSVQHHLQVTGCYNTNIILGTVECLRYISHTQCFRNSFYSHLQETGHCYTDIRITYCSFILQLAVMAEMDPGPSEYYDSVLTTTSP